MKSDWKPANKEEAVAELRAMAQESNRVRHPFQNINPMWKGRPLDEVLSVIADKLEES